MLTAILIGNESLTRECAAMWLARGHRIAAVVTRSPEIAAWAQAQGLEVVDQGAPGLGDRLAQHLATQSPPAPAADWVLSIANLNVIAPAVLSLARFGGVNFHDGPLPRHAGLNAPAWAILQGETSHGITWHLIEAGVDEGDILLTRGIPISADDTTLTLNTRCFEAALDSFPEVIAGLETGVPQRRAQDLTGRQLHLRSDRPAAMGRLDFNQTSEQILRLVRALDHGSYLNQLTSAKIFAGRRIVLVGQAERAEGRAAPGTVLSASPDGLVVATANGALRLGRLTCLRGLPICPATVLDPHLDSPTSAEVEHLTQALAALAPDDGRARRALAGFAPTDLVSPGEARAPETASEGVIRLPLTPGVPADRAPALLALALTRALGAEAGAMAYATRRNDLPDYLSGWWPIQIGTQTDNVAGAEAAIRAAMQAAGAGFARDLIARDPALRGAPAPQLALSTVDAPLAGAVVTATPEALYVDTARLPRAKALALHARIEAITARLIAAPDSPLDQIDALSKADHALLARVNATAKPHDRSLTVPRAFEAQVARSPDATAVAFEDVSLTYTQLNARANQAAHVLRAMGVGPGTLVGLCTPRSTALIIGALAILKAGGAYVPMDPAYPAERLALFVEDSACPVIVTTLDLVPHLPQGAARHLCLDDDPRIAGAPETDLADGPAPADLAYLIYTSGSTGRPKGVMVEHRNVVNFFTGMDDRIDHGPGSVWLALTSLSFDISVLELFWTLARGFKVVLSSDESRKLVAGDGLASDRHMDFSLYYWGNDDGTGNGASAGRYDLLLEGARFADSHGFCALWTPERHFHAFGGPYPNPAVTGAAVAATTRNLAVRAGSCVVPLHHPARVAEEWAVIDNLTRGRAGIAVASGWHPDDFVLRPENTPPANRPALFAATDQIRRLWRGEAVDFPTADGRSFAVVTQPRPISHELPVWVTTAGNPETWREAGRIGAHVLTHLLGQSIAEVGEKITLYHAALREAGHDPADFTVTLMLHTYLAADRETARETARGPMKDYLRSAAALIKHYAWAFPAFKRPKGVTDPAGIDIASLSTDEMEAILDFAFQRYFEDQGLFGTVEDAMNRIEQLKRIGVTEVACLIDYGIAPATVMAGFAPLAQLVRRANAGGGPAQDDWSIAAQIIRHGVTHLQCTPSMARMIALNDDSRMALARIGTVMLGGEALSGALVAELRSAGVARILNMYGPTETTIWSTLETVTPEAVGLETAGLESVGTSEGVSNIGTPLANQQVHVLDEAGHPVPPGQAGELWIGGEGVTRGYWHRPELTADRFRPDPFVAPDPAAPQTGRIYRTGDLVRMRPDGRLDFLGRADFQVKLRGHRIELGEIEAAIEAQPGIRQAVVLAREDTPGDLRLVAYVTGDLPEPDLRAALTARLPDHMRPAHILRLETFPLTPNRKVDRKALPAPSTTTIPPETEDFVAPDQGTQTRIAVIWCQLLGVPRVDPRDNFFALGGHSLLAVQLHREIRQTLGTPRLSITDIFRFPTLGALAAHLDGGAAPVLGPPTALYPFAVVAATADAGAETAARDDAMARRRAMRAGRGGETA